MKHTIFDPYGVCVNCGAAINVVNAYVGRCSKCGTAIDNYKIVRGESK